MKFWVLALFWGCVPGEDDPVPTETASDTDSADTALTGAWELSSSVTLSAPGVLNHPGAVDHVVVDDTLWSLSIHAPTLARIDLATRELVEVIDIKRALSDGRLAVDEDGAWLGQGREPALSRFDFEAGMLEVVDLEVTEINALAWDSEYEVLWVVGNGATSGGAELIRYDPDGETLRVSLDDKAQTLGFDPELSTLAVGTGLADSGAVLLVERETNEITNKFETDAPPTAVLPVSGGVLIGFTDSVVLGTSNGSKYAFFEAEAGEVRAIEPDGNGAYWVLCRQADRDEQSGVLYGTVSHVTRSGDGLETWRGGYNAQFLAVDPVSGAAITNSEGSSAVYFVDADGTTEVVPTGTSASVARTDPADQSRMAVVGRLGENVHILEDGEVVARYETDGWPIDVQWSQGGTVMVLEHHRGRIVEVDPATGEGTTFFAGLGINKTLVFSSLAAAADGGWYVSYGDADVVVRVSAEGELDWQVELGDPQEWVSVDNPDQLQVMEDEDGRVWVMRTRDARLHVLDGTDGSELLSEGLGDRNWLGSPDRVRPQLFPLWFGEGVGWVGPYALDLDAVSVADEPGVRAERVVGEGQPGWAVADEEAFGWAGIGKEPVPDVYGGGVWIGWDDGNQVMVVSRFAEATVEQWRWTP